MAVFLYGKNVVERENGWDNDLGIPSRWVDGGRRKEIAVLCGNPNCHKPINAGEATVTISPISRIGFMMFHKQCAPRAK